MIDDLRCGSRWRGRWRCRSVTCQRCAGILARRSLARAGIDGEAIPITIYGRPGTAIELPRAVTSLRAAVRNHLDRHAARTQLFGWIGAIADGGRGMWAPVMHGVVVQPTVRRSVETLFGAAATWSLIGLRPPSVGSPIDGIEAAIVAV